MGSNVGQLNNYSSYTCAGLSDTGPEVYYRLDAPATGTVTVRLTPTSANLDLIVVGATGTDCNPAGDCIGSSQLTGTNLDQVVFSATQGQTYYFIVDGFGGATSAYSLDVACTKD